jgi:Uma2 family endonuclease
MYTVRVTLPTTDDDLLRITEENPGWQVERDANGTIVMSPTGSRSRARSLRLGFLLETWNRAHGHGVTFDSSTGFRMWEQAVLSPDASWISRERWEALNDRQREKYAPLVPDVCIELVSESDEAQTIQRKLVAYREHGARYVVMIDPYTRSVWTDGEAPPHFPTDFTEIFDVR